MDIKKSEFRLRPPREPITNLAAVVADYKWRFPRERRDMVWEYCRTAPSFNVAVYRACHSRGADGKMHNHQTRVRESARVEFGERIMRQSREIRIIARTVYADPSDLAPMTYLERMDHAVYEKGGHPIPDSRFDALHDLLDDIKPGGIGPVTLYDVATRIGAYLDVHPTSLYVHAGVRLGLMWLVWSLPARVGAGHTVGVWKAERITAAELHAWWPEFDGLPPDEVEDLLCTYRDCFADFDEEG